MSVPSRTSRLRRAAMLAPVLAAAIGGAATTASAAGVSSASAFAPQVVPYEPCERGTLTDPFHVKNAYDGVGLYGQVTNGRAEESSRIESLQGGMCLYRRGHDGAYENDGLYTVVRRGDGHGSAVWGYVLRDAIY